MGFSLGSLAESITGNGLLSMGGDAVNAWQSGKNAREMQKRQLDWERQKATSAHQWEVEDLQKAGLNPILSAGGSGAQAGGISAPTVDTSGYSRIGDHLQNAINTAIDARRQAKEAEKTDSDIKVQGEQQLLLRQQTLSEMLKQGLISKQTANTAMQTELAQWQINRTQLDLQQQRQRFTLEIAERRQNIENLRKAGKYKEAEIEEKQVKNFWLYWDKEKDAALKELEIRLKNKMITSQSIRNWTDFMEGELKLLEVPRSTMRNAPFGKYVF